MIDEILEKRPGYIPSKLLKGRVLSIKRQFKSAASIYESLIKYQPDSGFYNFLLGQALVNANDIKQAKIYLSLALEKEPGLFAARLLMANLYFSDGTFTLADSEVQKLLAGQPENYQANILLGKIKTVQKQYTAAKEIFSHLIEKNPKLPEAYFRLAIINRVQKDLKNASKNFKAVVEIAPLNMDAFTGFLSIYIAQEKYDTAIKECDQHLTKVVKNPFATALILDHKGNILLKKKQKRLAILEFEKAIKTNPEFITPYLTLAQLYSSENKIEQAINLYQAVIDKRSDMPAPFSLLGGIYEKQKKYGLAEQKYLEALDIDPDFVPALNNLSLIYAEQDKKLNEAFEMARKANTLIKGSPTIADTLGWVYFKKQLYDNAIEIFQDCTEMAPENAIFQYHLGMAQFKKGLYKQAENTLKKALSLQADFTGAEQAKKIIDAI